MHSQDQKSKNNYIMIISNNNKNSFHLSKNGIANPLVKKNEEIDMNII